eukprot:g27891.t1
MSGEDGKQKQKKKKKDGKASRGKPISELPEELEELRSKVHVEVKHAHHTHAVEDPEAFHGYDNSFDLENFKKNFAIRITEHYPEKHVLRLDMQGVDAPIANALRRIMIAEVPTMAVEKVIIFQNTSVMQDEVLAHRLGLVPILADADLFKTVAECGGVPSEENTTVFTLEVECTEHTDAPAHASDKEKYINGVVYSSALKWVPQGNQAEKFKQRPIRPVHHDIILTKLRPGQVIEAELHVIKGVGKEHAKWSPVCTATYRMAPIVRIVSPVVGEQAEALKRLCPMDVFDIEDVAGRGTARATRPLNCSLCRECLRPAEFSEKIELRRDREHFLFEVETTGVYPPAVVFERALRIFMDKAVTFRKELSRVVAPAARQQGDAAEGSRKGGGRKGRGRGR